MRSELYSIPLSGPGRLAIMPRPRSGDWLADEIKDWKQTGVNFVISLLTDDEIIELGLTEEQKVCRENQIEYLSFPIADRHAPDSVTDTLALVCKINEWLKQNQSVAIHCRMGIGRSALLAACVLVGQGLTTEAAFEQISKARGTKVPDTEEQIQWVLEFSSKLAGDSK